MELTEREMGRWRGEGGGRESEYGGYCLYCNSFRREVCGAMRVLQPGQSGPPWRSHVSLRQVSVWKTFDQPSSLC